MEWWAVMPGLALKGGILLALAGGGIWLARGRSAAERHAAWLLALAAIWLLPIFACALPGWSLPAPRNSAPAFSRTAFGELRPFLKLERPDPNRAKFSKEIRPGLNLPWLAFSVWLAGVAAVMSYFLHGAWRVARLVRVCRPVDDLALAKTLRKVAGEYGFSHPVKLVESSSISSPAVWGFLRPVVLLPAQREGWTPATNRMVLLHELAHLRRWDNWTQLFAQFTSAIWWFNPLVWHAVRGMRLEREQACDDLVLSGGIKASAYADLLLALSRDRAGCWTRALGLAAMAQPSLIQTRLLAILSPKKNRSALYGRYGLMVATLAGLASLGLASAEIGDQPKAAPSPISSPAAEPTLSIQSDSDFQKVIESAAQGDRPSQAELDRIYSGGKEAPRDPALAISRLEKSAEQGNAYAQELLGEIYFKGQGVPKDEARGAKLIRQSAESGFSLAQGRLGSLYLEGKIGRADYAEALRWLRKAVAGNDPLAQSTLGYMYLTGLGGVTKDTRQSAEWFLKAAPQGDPEAQYYLGHMYEEGMGVDRDPAKAVEWYTKSAAQNVTDAQYYLGEMYRRSKGVAKDLGQAFAWYNKAAVLGNTKAQYSLGKMHEEGAGVPQDFKIAASWYQKAVDQGDPVGMWALGCLYGKGEGVPKDPAKGHALIREAAEKGFSWAQLSLAFAYYEGEDVPQDYAESVKWLRKAADQGDPQALYYLSLSYRDGEGVEQDDAEADKLLKQAVTTGDSTVLNELGKQYRDGDGVPRDLAKALDLFRQAAEKGDPEGQYDLAGLYHRGAGVPQDREKARYWYTQAEKGGYEKATMRLKEL